MKDQLKDEDLHRVSEGEVIHNQLKDHQNLPARRPATPPSLHPALDLLIKDRSSGKSIFYTKTTNLYFVNKFICTGVLPKE